MASRDRDWKEVISLLYPFLTTSGGGVGYLNDLYFSVNQTDPDTGNTPLHWSCMENPSMTKWLISHGANVNAKNNDGDTPLDGAIIFRRSHVAIDLLLKAGAHSQFVDNKVTFSTGLIT